MILGALSHNRKGYFPASLSTLIILPVHEFEESFHQNLPMMIFMLEVVPTWNNNKRLRTK
jgi:hypothetical protein